MRSPTLRLIQGLAVCVLRRDATGAIQGLRMLLEICDEPDAVAILRQLEANLSPQERFWFGNLLGARKSLQEA